MLNTFFKKICFMCLDRIVLFYHHTKGIMIVDTLRTMANVTVGPRLKISPWAEITVSLKGSLAIGDGTEIRDYSAIKTEGELRIGNNVLIARGCVVSCRARIEIGNDCLIAENVSIRDHDHAHEPQKSFNEQGYVDSPVRIGNNVWLGAKVTVLRGVSIGDNTIVGANAVVTKDLPAGVVAVGIPARVIRGNR